MTVDQMPNFGFAVGDPPRGLVCLLYEESPRTSAAEQNFVLLASVGSRFHGVLEPHPFKRIHIYQVMQ